MRKMNNMPSGEPARNGLVLYFCFVAAAVLLWLERHATMTQSDHTIALLAIIGAFFLVAVIWLGGMGLR